MKKHILILLYCSLLAGCVTDERNPVASKNSANEVTSGYAPVNGLRMYYEMSGSGPPLVLIHGGGSTIETTFGRVIPLLTPFCRVIAIEIQAHGHTADIDRPLSFQQDADDVAALLGHLKIPSASIFGFSNGASTTLEIAIRHPQLVNKIIVASTFYKKTGAVAGFWEMMNNPSFENMPAVYKEAFLRINPDSSALYAMYSRDVARMQSFADIPGESIRSIRAPALILCGDRDVVTTEHAVEMARIIPNARLAILPGGHGDYMGEISAPVDSDRVAATVAMIRHFLNDTVRQEIR